MDEDRQDKAGILPGGDAAKRAPPTIDLAASAECSPTVKARNPNSRIREGWLSMARIALALVITTAS